LVRGGAKALVVACNTASAAALPTLRERFALPIVGMEPAVKPAASLSRNGRIGVLATPRTAQSERLAQLIQGYAAGAQVYVQECADLVPLIEAGLLDGPVLEGSLEQYVRPLVERGVDVLVLGCTHYPLVQSAIEAVAGPGIQVINPAPAVARQVARVLRTQSLEAPPNQCGGVEWFTTGEASSFANLLATFGSADHAERVQISDSSAAQAVELS
jgi:glutamate racemase